MKVASIIGARPQFIKASPVSKALSHKHDEIIIHTGQHYDYEMSAQFFKELEIPEPDYNLEVGSGTHGYQTGEILKGCEKVLLAEKPDIVLVYGDTNSTLAGALGAAKLHIPVAHVEAGLRSFNRSMPEEINRVVTDHISRLLFCPTDTAVENLKREGITEGVHKVGDVMVDVLLQNREKAAGNGILAEIGMQGKEYFLATIHRASNTDNIERLKAILKAFEATEKTIILPLHPRTKKAIEDSDIAIPPNVRMIGPVGYIEFMCLMANSTKIMTDSGGIQKEAYILRKPCITLRDETEWVETVQDGWNVLVGADVERIVNAAKEFEPAEEQHDHFGAGDASLQIREIIENFEGWSI